MRSRTRSARGDLDDLRDELGDLLLQVVYHARMAEEQNAVRVRRRGRGDHAQNDPAASACVRRRARPPDAGRRHQRVGAHQGRGKGRARRAAAGRKSSREDRCCPASRPGSRRWRARWNCSARPPASASTGTTRARCCDKIREEADEIEAALDRGDKEELAEETGDLLFALVNLARHVGADPEMALRGTNAKFERRFGYIERDAGGEGTLAGKRVAGRDGRAVG